MDQESTEIWTVQPDSQTGQPKSDRLLDYRCIHRSVDAANYIRDDEGLDLIYAHRPIARRLLREAVERDTAMGRLRVVSAEALIGFKLQALVNNPSRGRDLDDIRALLRVQQGRLNMQEVREYFALFKRTELLDELLAEIADKPA